MASLTDKLALIITADSAQAVSALKQVGSTAENELKKAEVAGTGFATNLTSIATTAAPAAGIALATLGAIAVKNAEQGEVAHTRLDVAITNVGKSTKAFAPAVEDVAKKMATLGFNQDDVNNSLARLVPATHSVTEAIKLQALAADIARARGVDLATATNYLVQAEQGRYTNLQRLGIISKDQVKDFKSAQDAIDTLSHTYGGQASAYSQTFQGKQAALNAEVHNLSETFGQQLLPVLTQYVGYAGEAAAVTNTATQAADHFGINVNTIGGAIARTLPPLAILGIATDAHKLATDKDANSMSSAQKVASDLSAAIKKLSDDTASGANQSILAKDSRAVADAQQKQKVITDSVTQAMGDLGDATDQTDDATKRLSAATNQFKQDAATGRTDEFARDRRALTQATLDAALAEKVVTDATIQAQAAADIATGSVISLADAYVILGQTAAQNAVSSLGNLNNAAFSQFDALQGVDGAASKFNQSLKDLTKTESSSGGSTKSATAAFYDQQQKLIAVRDASQAVGDAQLDLQRAQRDNTTATQDLATAAQHYEDVLHGVSASSQLGQDAATKLQEAQDGLVTANYDVKDAEKALADARKGGKQEDIARATVQLHDAQRAQKQAVTDLNEAQREYNGTLHGFKQGSQEATDAQNQLQTAWDHAQDSTKALREATDQTHDSVINLGRADADLQGKLDSIKTGGARAELKSFQDKLSDVKASAKDFAEKVGENITESTGSVSQGITAEIDVLKTIVDSNPLLKGAFDDVLNKLQDELGKFLPQHQQLGPSSGGLRTFDEGGWVDAPAGQAVPAIVHGGEFVVSREMLRRGSTGHGAIPTAAPIYLIVHVDPVTAKTWHELGQQYNNTYGPAKIKIAG